MSEKINDQDYLVKEEDGDSYYENHPEGLVAKYYKSDGSYFKSYRNREDHKESEHYSKDGCLKCRFFRSGDGDSREKVDEWFDADGRIECRICEQIGYMGRDNVPTYKKTENYIDGQLRKVSEEKIGMNWYLYPSKTEYFGELKDGLKKELYGKNGHLETEVYEGREDGLVSIEYDYKGESKSFEGRQDHIVEERYNDSNLVFRNFEGREDGVTSESYDKEGQVTSRSFRGRENGLWIEDYDEKGAIKEQSFWWDRFAGAFYSDGSWEDQESFRDDANLLLDVAANETEETLAKALKAIAREASGEGNNWDEMYNVEGAECFDIYNLNWTLMQIVNDHPQQAGNVLDIIDSCYNNSTNIDDHSRWTIEAIGCQGDKELAKRAARMLGRFDFKDDSEHREACNIAKINTPIDNILEAYKDDKDFQKVLKIEEVRGMSSRKDFDPLAKKEELLARIKQKDGTDSSKTADVKTGKVSKKQKSAAKDRTEAAKQFMKGMHELNR